MRHRAPRPLTNLRHRLPRATARLLGQAAKLRPGRALVALMVVLSLGTAAYAALASVTGGSSNRQTESAGPTMSRDDESPNGSRDSERLNAADKLPSDSPTPSATSSAPSTRAARQPAARRGTASTAAEDDTPPTTSLSAEYPSGDAATFSFSADEAASFTCSLDGAAYASCDSPTQYSDLAPGWHTFAVRATDAAGNVDPSPAQTRWHATDGRSADQ
jgi:hypothetical protein